MASENLETVWTKQSNENNAFFTNGTKLTVTDCRRVDNCYMTKDDDISVPGDFVHYVDMYEDASSVHDARTTFFLCKNRLGDGKYQWDNSYDSLQFASYEWTADILRIQVLETTGGNIYSNGLGVQLTPGSGPHYLNCDRVDNVSTVEVFSDIDRTSSLGSNPLTLQSVEEYTVAALGGWDDDNSSTKNWDGWWDNIDLALESIAALINLPTKNIVFPI